MTARSDASNSVMVPMRDECGTEFAIDVLPFLAWLGATQAPPRGRRLNLVHTSIPHDHWLKKREFGRIGKMRFKVSYSVSIIVCQLLFVGVLLKSRPEILVQTARCSSTRGAQKMT